MTIDASPNGASSDSYIDLAGATTYFNKRLHTEQWDDELAPTEREKALKWATIILDRLPWRGRLPNDTQALRWPRSYVDDLDGTWFPDDAIPAFLEQATCELGMELSISDRTLDNTAEQLNALTVATIKLDFNLDYIKTILPDTVVEIISPYLSNSSFGDMNTTRILKV